MIASFMPVTSSLPQDFPKNQRMGRFSKTRFNRCIVGVILLVMCLCTSVAFAQEEGDDDEKPHPIIQFFQMHRRDRPQQSNAERAASSSTTENAHRECQRQFKECRTQLEEQQRQYLEVYREYAHLVSIYEEGSRRNMDELKELRTTLGDHSIAKDVTTLLKMQNDLMYASERMQVKLFNMPSEATEPTCHCNVTGETVPPQLEQTIRELHASHVESMERLLGSTWLEERIEASLGNRTCLPSQADSPTNQDNDRIRALEHEKSALMGEYHLLQSLYEKMEMKYEDILRNYNDTLQVYLDQNLEEAVQNYSGVWIRELQATIRGTKANCTVSLQELQQKMDAQKENMTLAHKELEEKFQNYQETAAEKLQLVLDLNEDLKQSHQDAVLQLKFDYETELEQTQVSLQEACTNSINGLSKAHAEEVKHLTERVQNCSGHLEGTERELQQVTRELEHFRAQHQDSLQRADYWEQAFAQRSYFNVTHMAHDLQLYCTQRYSDARHLVQQTVSDALRTMQETVVEPTVQRARDLHEQHVVPVIRQSNAVYEEKIHPHIQQSRELYKHHVHPRLLEVRDISYPYYVEYLEPHVMTLRRQRIDLQNRCIIVVKNVFDDMVLQYAQYCPEVVASLKSKQMPASMLHHVDLSCQHARESVLTWLQVVSILFLLIFHRTIIRILWYLLCFLLLMLWYWNPTRLLWYLNPIRLLFVRRRR